MKKRLVWTRDLRDLLWSRFFARFGARASWGGARRPCHKDFVEFSDDMSVAFSKLTGRNFTRGSITIQLAWGLSLQDGMSDQGRVYNWVQNLSAALDAGVLSCRDLPNLLLVEHSVPVEPVTLSAVA